MTPNQAFYRLSREERLEQLLDRHLLTKEQADCLLAGKTLPLSAVDTMIENAIGIFGLPFGLAQHFTINDHSLWIPMVVEEPSVIAAASNGAKRVARSGGFHISHTERIMLGHITFNQLSDPETFSEQVSQHKADLLQLAASAHPSIVSRGGGPIDLFVKLFPNFTSVYLTVDTKEAMGANMINTMLEALKEPLAELAHQQPLMAILSNLPTESIATAQCTLLPETIKTSKMSGTLVAERIALATDYANVDPYRAATHNKGVMNGIDPVVIATGNDWRAVEAAVHSYASRDGHYQSITQWEMTPEGNLKGQLTAPLPIGSVGGTSRVNPLAKLSLDLLQQPSAKDLAGIMAAVGLAQNLSALRALVTTGIQAGHMALQYKSLAHSVGAVGQEIDIISRQLKKEKVANQVVAKTLLLRLREKN